RRSRASREPCASCVRPSRSTIVVGEPAPTCVLHSAAPMDEIRIRPAREAADFLACCALQRAVWGLSDLDVTSSIQLIATTHAGGSLLLAETPAGQPIGFAYAFPALRGTKPHLHSDMLAVLPDHQRHGVGARLKWAQRDDALARGIGLLTWTF